MNHDSYSDDYIARILRGVKSIAMIGASAHTNRPSYFVMKYLLGKGYRVIPVNPALVGQEILGQQVYGALADVPGPVEMVDIFRNSDAALAMTREAIDLKGKLGITVVWMQLGVRNDIAAAEAEAAGARRRDAPLPEDRIRAFVRGDRVGRRQLRADIERQADPFAARCAKSQARRQVGTEPTRCC